MSYVVLARRMRPQHFDEVLGQEHVARTLCNAIDQDRVAHAFLFCGPRGIGKTSMARILARALNCAQGPTKTPCYACDSCLDLGDGASVDVIEIDGASNRGVNEIRELREGVRYAPSRDRFKVYIIDEVHMLTTEAFNAMLKTLEEPPSHVKFIFATTEPQKIPVTILSRCQRFDFKRVPAKRIAARLEEICENEGIQAEKQALALIARQADGGMRDAMSLTDQVISFCKDTVTAEQVTQVLGITSRETLFHVTEAIFEKDVERCLRTLDHVEQSGTDLHLFAAALVGHLRDLAVVRASSNPDGLTDLTNAEVERAQKQLTSIPVDVISRMFNVAVQACEDMSRSSFARLVFEMALIRLTAIEPILPIDPFLQRLKALENNLPPDPPSGGGPPKRRKPPSGHASPPSHSEPPPHVSESIPPPSDPHNTANVIPLNRARTPAAPPQPMRRAARPSALAEDEAEPEPIPIRPSPPPAPSPASIPWTDPRAAWRSVLQHMRNKNQRVAVGTFEHARVLSIEPPLISVQMDLKFKKLVQGEVKKLELSACELLEGEVDWKLDIDFTTIHEVQDPTAPQPVEGLSIAEERDIEEVARQRRVTSVIEGHPLVRKASSIFSPVRSWVVLDDSIV